MNIAVPPRSGAGNAASFLARFERMRDGLGDLDARDAAAIWLRGHGLPRRTEEAWKYTDLRRLWERDQSDAGSEADAGHGHAAATALLADLFEAAGLDRDWPRMVFVDGVLSEALSNPPGNGICSGFGGVASLAVPDHPVVALNTMLARDGVSVRVPEGQDAGQLVLVTLCSGDRDVHLRHRVHLGKGASLTLVEIASGRGAYGNDGVMDVVVGEEASLHHVRLQEDSREAVSLSHVRATVAQRGCYDGFNMTLGGAVARHEVRARLEGAYAIVHVNGAQLLSGSQVADLTSAIVHDAPHTSSRQTVKNVLTARARGVFQGKILVNRVAQKTDGYQMNQALLLSEEAEIDAKPELEIFADDVKCSHGATAGALDEDQLFYLRSRGIPAREARTILVQAFLDEAFDLIRDEAVCDMLQHATASWWGRREK